MFSTSLRRIGAIGDIVVNYSTRIVASSSNALVASQKRTYFTRHVPEPKIQIHLPTNQEPESIESIVFSDGSVDEKKPVVLLVGWAGANPKHIEKYVKCYTDEGYRVVSLCPPCYHYSIPNSRVGFYMSPLFRAVDAKPGDFRTFGQCPIIVHSFSMNGVRGLISFFKWTEAEERPELRDRIKGIIFDSAPSRPYGRQDATAMVLSTPPIDALEKISDNARISLLTAFLNLRATLHIPLLAMVPFLRSFLSIYYYLQEYIQLPKEQLYLYSTADTMIKYKHVEKFIRKQQDKGANVQSINFGESDHCAHIRKDPELYKSACLNFIKKIEKITETPKSPI